MGRLGDSGRNEESEAEDVRDHLVRFEKRESSNEDEEK